jgi:hypothetical protein
MLTDSVMFRDEIEVSSQMRFGPTLNPQPSTLVLAWRGGGNLQNGPVRCGGVLRIQKAKLNAQHVHHHARLLEVLNDFPNAVYGVTQKSTP